MKKLIYLSIIITLFLFIKKPNSVTTNTKDFLNFDDFLNKAKIIYSFKIENINEYYQEYLSEEYKNFIHLINKVNYPNFLSTDSNNRYEYIKEPVILVNNNFLIPQNYIPNNLTMVSIDYIKRDYETLINKTTMENLKKFSEDYKINFTVFSAYRSYYLQSSIYNNGEDLLIAKPGCSEHQTGLAVDISFRDVGLTYELENHHLYSLLYNNLYKYGFILRYPKNKEHITNIPYEPWHFRYVGKQIAEIIYKEKITLEEYFYYYVPLIY